jgi:hypothetical protein
MSVTKATEIIKKEWPDVQPRIQENKIAVGNEVFVYTRQIEFSVKTGDEKEGMHLTFMAPASIAEGPENATLIRLGRSVSRQATPLLQDAFLESLNNKYGPPSMQAPRISRWHFDKDQQFLSKEKLDTLEATKKSECSGLREKLSRLSMEAVASGQSPSEIQRELNPLIQHCDEEYRAIITCQKVSDRELCPYSLRFEWLTGPTENFVKSYVAELYGIPLDQEEKDRSAHILKELEQRATEKARTNAGSDTKL